MMYKEFNEIDHRPLPLLLSPWMLTQVWNDLLFMHYPVSAESVSQFVPSALELDTFENKAWISIIPLRITNMRLRGIPPIPFMHSYLELNVRTYVIHQGIPGIYFFSLDADHLLVVAGARRATGLPYNPAKMFYEKTGETFRFKSELIQSHSISGKLDVAYQPGQILYEPIPGTLDHWLLERYSMYSFRGGNMLRGDIHHDKWKVTRAKAAILKQTMAPFLEEGTLSSQPLLHYSSRRRFFFYPLVKVD